MDIAKKPCSKCKEVKPLSDFNTCSAKPDGVSSACRLCNQAHWRKTHPLDRTPLADLPNEVWKLIPQDERYAVSNFGRVKRAVGGTGTRANKLCKQQPDDDGYMRVVLGSRNFNKKNYGVHTLVATAFIGVCPPDCDQVNHIDSDKANNTVDNLEWSDSLHNNQWRSVLGHTKQGSDHHNSKLTEQDIPVIRQMLADKIHIRTIAKHFNVSTYPIMSIKKNRWWKHVK